MKKHILLLISAIFTAHNAFSQSDWFMAQTKAAPVKSVVATSELVESQYAGKYLYPPINILDGNFENTWCEADQNGSGIGESITIEFTEAVSFDEIQIVNGFATKDYYKKNNRVKSILLTQVANKHFQQKEYSLKDDIPDWQSIKFALDQTAQTITIKITDVFKGSKYDDTCLDDIRLLYKGKVIPFKGVEELKKIQEENSKQMLKSTAADFKKQFLALFYGNNKMYLKSQKSDDVITISRFKEEITNISYHGELIKSGTKEELSDKLSELNLWRWYFEDDDEGSVNGSWYGELLKKKADYLLVGIDDGDWSEPEYEIGNFRLLKTQMVSYVETTTAIIIKIEGNTLYWNGTPYTVLTEKQVVDARVAP